MAPKEKQPEFVVTDRRLFSSDGELRHDVVDAEERRAERERETTEAQQRTNEERAAQRQTAPASSVLSAETPAGEPQPEPPTAQEQQASVDAYKESTRKIDDRIENEMRRQGRPHRAQDFEMSFDK